ncbi:bifunctional glutamate N-acetyltransferase/amino-acid acetyltransferase ArgJ [Leucobacter sp. OH2974_COT-288]|nr:bifunctional glutamate N-acetyltransferase/amino-acid acetyltransferase ArgJ [Leucobacter sp. OH2974_COT-288]
MTVTFPYGFTAAGISVGLKSSGKPDLALVLNNGAQPQAAAVYTSNRAQANPILWSKQADIANTRAIILNSGSANCFTGQFGYETTKLTAEAVAQQLTQQGGVVVTAQQVQVCSTGLIGYGDQAMRDKILGGIPELFKAQSLDDLTAPEAILTTDSVTKTALHESPVGWRIGAMAKGAGMLAPGLATMLVVITTDARLTAATLQTALRQACDSTFNCLDSDGCMSTNDQVTLLSSGENDSSVDVAEFTAALTKVCDDLAAQLQADAEGASHSIDIVVTGAKSTRDATVVGRALARNNLFKAAIYGNDPNWGRVLAAIGTTDADFDPYQVDVSFNGVRLCSAGAPDRPVQECDLSPRRTLVEIALNAAADSGYSAKIRTNDLTKEYVHENSAYSS